MRPTWKRLINLASPPLKLHSLDREKRQDTPQPFKLAEDKGIIRAVPFVGSFALVVIVLIVLGYTRQHFIYAVLLPSILSNKVLFSMATWKFSRMDDEYTMDSGCSYHDKSPNKAHREAEGVHI
eukprot:5423966-Amphidinium_carterae.2